MFCLSCLKAFGDGKTLKFRVAFSTILVLLVAFTAGLMLCYGAGSGDASSAISSAESKIISCYGAAVDAQKAGANVSELLNVLNEAGWLLSRAKLSYSREDFDSAFAYASQCQSMLEGFAAQAEGLRLEAEKASQQDFMYNFVGSGVSALSIVVGGSALWALLKRREKSKEKT